MGNPKTISRQLVPNGIRKILALLIAVYICISGVSSIVTGDKNHPNYIFNSRTASK